MHIKINACVQGNPQVPKQYVLCKILPIMMQVVVGDPVGQVVSEQRTDFLSFRNALSKRWPGTTHRYLNLIKMKNLVLQSHLPHFKSSISICGHPFGQQGSRTFLLSQEVLLYSIVLSPHRACSYLILTVLEEVIDTSSKVGSSVIKVPMVAIPTPKSLYFTLERRQHKGSR